jgi:hypothetical protein
MHRRAGNPELGTRRVVRGEPALGGRHRSIRQWRATAESASVDVFRFEGVPVALYFGLLTAPEPATFFRTRLLFSAYLRTLVRSGDAALSATAR